MHKLLKEPLIHFLGGALLVFGFFWATGTNRDPADYAINIGESDIARMKAGWVQNFRRPPSEKELDGLIEQQIVEEIYYREALRLGLDRNDPIIRRRLFTKMRFLNDQDGGDSEPSDAELQEWMEQNPDKYRLSSSYDLQHAYLGQIGDMSDTDIKAMTVQLNAGSVAAADVSKPISLPAKLYSAETPAIARQFGERFAAALDGMETGKWVGPVPSGFGQHLIRIEKRIPGKAAALDDVRQAVTNDWRAARKAKLERDALAQYRSQYEISVAGRK